MKNWITPDGSYYVGDIVAEGSIEVTERPNEYFQWVGGEWVFDADRQKGDRIAALMTAYDSDIDRLNKAWLAALIADGVGEVTRQTVIKQQISDLDAQLEADILTIIMEQ